MSVAFSARLLDGRQIAARFQEQLREQVVRHAAATGRVPLLAAVLVGDDLASQVYVRNKRRACAAAGIASRLVRLAATTETKELIAVIQSLNSDSAVNGILVQLPLPRGVDPAAVLDAIDPQRDVDGFHPFNTGLLLQGRPRFVPCTPLGVLHILAASQLPVAGRHVCVIGRSEIVGKPLAALLVQKTGPLGPEFSNATVTVCHSRTPDLEQHLRAADVVVAAAGQPGLITGGMLRPGAVVIDVGINRTAEGLVGDVDFASAARVAGALTPVPGGVGPMTVAMLMQNTLLAARLQAGLAGDLHNL